MTGRAAARIEDDDTVGRVRHMGRQGLRGNTGCRRPTASKCQSR